MCDVRPAVRCDSISIKNRVLFSSCVISNHVVVISNISLVWAFDKWISTILASCVEEMYVPTSRRYDATPVDTGITGYAQQVRITVFSCVSDSEE